MATVAPLPPAVLPTPPSGVDRTVNTVGSAPVADQPFLAILLAASADTSPPEELPANQDLAESPDATLPDPAAIPVSVLPPLILPPPVLPQPTVAIDLRTAVPPPAVVTVPEAPIPTVLPPSSEPVTEPVGQSPVPMVRQAVVAQPPLVADLGRNPPFPTATIGNADFPPPVQASAAVPTPPVLDTGDVYRQLRIGLQAQAQTLAAEARNVPRPAGTDFPSLLTQTLVGGVRVEVAPSAEPAFTGQAVVPAAGSGTIATATELRTTADARLPGLPLSDQVADGIVTHARTLQSGGRTEFQFRLDPPELGRVTVHMTTDGPDVSARVVVASDGVRHLIEQQLPDLRQRLESFGLTINRFDVVSDYPSAGDGRAGRQEPPPEPRDPPPAFPRPPRPATDGRTDRIDVTA